MMHLSKFWTGCFTVSEQITPSLFDRNKSTSALFISQTISEYFNLSQNKCNLCIKQTIIYFVRNQNIKLQRDMLYIRFPFYEAK